MENMTTFYYLAVAAIIIGLIIYAIYTNKRKKQSVVNLERFLHILSQSFHDAKWRNIDIYSGDKRTNEKIASDINEKLQKELKNEFDNLLRSLYCFPDKCFKYFTGDPATNNFVAKIFPHLKEYYDEYRLGSSNALLESLRLRFFSKTEEIILTQLQKDSKLQT